MKLRMLISFAAAGVLLAPSSALSAVEVFAPLTPAEARARVDAWAAERGVDDPQRLAAAKQIWDQTADSVPAGVLLDRVVEAFAALDPATEQLLNQCGLLDPPIVPPELDLTSAGQDEFYRANVGLFYARYLTERRMYDEALLILAGIDPKQVVDPAAYFFYKAVAEQELLQVNDALATLEQLLVNTQNPPVRYTATATLMQHDLKDLKEKSLDEISRLMSDSGRRLELGRGGHKVQGVQERIITGLDELIKKIEAQSGGGGGGGSGSQGGNQSSNPAADSVVKGSTAPGEIDKKEYDDSGVWGKLPPKVQAKAKNLINRSFPAHYRQAIETYFKKLATRPAKPE